MKSNLAPIIEKWAEIYPPISHNPSKKSKDKAFYLIRTINDNSEFMRNSNTAKSPAVAYSVLIDAEGTNNAVVSYAHNIYFLCRARQQSLAKSARQDDDLGMDEQMRMDDMAQDLLSYLNYLKHYGHCPVTYQTFDAVTMQSLAGLQIAHAEWASIPVKYGEWHILALQIEQNQPRNLQCFNPEIYNTASGDDAPQTSDDSNP